MLSSRARIPSTAWYVACAVLGAMAVPLAVADPYWQHLIVLTVVFSILALSLDIIIGHMGQFSFGHQAFFGVGAYATAILTVKFGWPVWSGVLAGIVAASALGLVVGVIALKRTRGLYLAIVTLGVGQIIWLVARNWFDLTGGLSGIPMVPPLWIYVPAMGRVDLDVEQSYYYFALAMLVLTIYLITVWGKSKSGQAVSAIRENEQLSETIGINPFKYYVSAFVFAAALAGLAGVTYAHFVGQVSPLSLSLYYMFWSLVMVIVGGMRTIVGPILGAWVFVFVPELLESAQEYRLVIFGALLLCTIIFMPRGIYPALRSRIYPKVRTPLSRGLEQHVHSSLNPGSQNKPEHRAKSALQTMFTWADISKPSQRANARSAILIVKNLAVHFGGLRAIQDLSFDVAEGEIFGLIGPNGAGKTTCFNAISGVVPPSAGDLIYNGEHVTGFRPYDVAKRGLIRTFQLTSLFAQLTVQQNVVVGSHLKRRGGIIGAIGQSKGYRLEEEAINTRAEEILGFVGLGHVVNERASQLGFGDQRRLEIAIALAAGPMTLLLDEPAAGMSPVEALDFMRLIRAIRDRGITILLIEHNMRVVMGLCDRVLVLHYGAKVVEGSPEEVAASSEVREVYLGRDDDVA